jgi:hypothetical protein
MKKLLFTVVALIATFFIYSQENKDTDKMGFSKGDILIGGDIRHSFLSPSSAMVGPNSVFFIEDNIAVEFGFAFGHDNGSLSTFKASSSDFSVGARYYIFSLKNRFRTYTSLAWNFGAWENGNQRPTYQKLSIGTGVNYFFNPKIVFNLGIGNLVSYSTIEDTKRLTTDFNLNLNEFSNMFKQPTFGVSYKF